MSQPLQALGSSAATAPAGQGGAAEKFGEGKGEYLPELAARLEKGDAIVRDLLGPTAIEGRRSLLVAPAAEGRSCNRVLFWFAGNGLRFAPPRPLRIWPNAHVIMVRDQERSFCLAGIDGLGETYAACIHSLQRVAEALGGTESYFIGVSAGGYPGLRYAIDMQGKGALLFSPPTTLDLRDDPGAPMSKYPQLTRLYSRARELCVDIVPYYAAQKQRPSTMLLYATEHKRDAWLAERFKGVGGMTLVPFKTSAHLCPGALPPPADASLTKYMKQLFELTPYHEGAA